jgi:hypothetical protein
MNDPKNYKPYKYKFENLIGRKNLSEKIDIKKNK